CEYAMKLPKVPWKSMATISGNLLTGSLLIERSRSTSHRFLHKGKSFPTPKWLAAGRNTFI
ncbi:hypothetical protein, partial [Stenotrophomonas maltophilia]|uniref:hypothetical protein n=1 Tax=Stenotrophomonas maltophilia TaxID=40324 RepID=UPI0019D3D9C0